MTPAPSECGIALVVANPQALQHGSTPRHRFGIAGGTIGSHGASWTLVDKAGRVQPVHCEIRHSDGAFCVIDRSGLTHVNGARDPLGAQVGARLSDGDILHIGPYQVAVHLHDAQHALPDASRHLAQYEVSEILNDQGGGMDDLPRDRYVFEREGGAPAQDAVFRALAAPHDPHADLDPLRALDAAEQAASAAPMSPDAADALKPYAAHVPTQPDLASTRYAAVAGSPKTPTGDFRMPQSREHYLSDPAWTAASPEAAGDTPQAAAALLQGMGIALDDLDTPASRALLLEAGQALGAAIRGIAALYGAGGDPAPRMAMNALTLQPIEDNPLRLGQSYPDTLRAMFSSKRSVVHLSPMAAVEESMTQLKLHQAAVVKGIESGLEALLHAFSPEHLLQRFRRYRTDQPAQGDDADWAWRMYAHYYDELSSARQRGFEKLFWEIFAQAYDRALRAEAQ
ncbi:type VI secretion system-associated FHA domain protein TagH [Achromobacter sp. NFACC18-2]|uniref:type VI secretion system-associated FHA domain protein TagH n=1 Tax=Achromobacter sp. NFACC18-2 TaxID=1564112 RepID=UPI0008CDE2ED|nr:type VI secretion system-associated FHA domain protein TagH [Achromobacter sp. NFACC18-2]SEK09467.1 FHA domain protein [Achromobacter sp. NFACC18-2]